MTDISFYHLQRRSLEETLPKLLERVIASKQRAVVLAESEEQVEAISSRLWTYDADSFLPHGSARDGFPAEQPIYLTSGEENPNGASILVLIDGRLPGFLSGFARCLDLFNGHDPESVQGARERWRAYKADGHPVTYWQQNDDGRWEKKA
ncbi:DNA polymerase III subunit chi [Iodidimonas sp. SYSU 1G8]|uniref:DNA polymerase III subunit chi n=1 Tax=Iodidimonas sp. SYSU 1G8 TaxID=3133967 RepID=UPI0031FF3A7E